MKLKFRSLPYLQRLCGDLDINPRTPRGRSFDPTFSSKSNTFLFGFFCAPFCQIAEFFLLTTMQCSFHVCNHIILAFRVPVTGPSPQIGDFRLFRKTEENQQKLKNTFSIFFITSCKLPFLYLSGFWGENSEMFIIQNKSVFQKIAHFVSDELN